MQSMKLPWTRLAAEFVVIVVGVLVALAVDAAWEVRSDRRQEVEYYRALAQDVRADTAEYRIALWMTRRSVEASQEVRAAILGDPLRSERPLSKSLYYASWVNYPDWASGTIDELYSAGTIRLIRDEEIKQALHTYRALVAEWRPRIQGPEYSAFQTYRAMTAGMIPLEAAIAYETGEEPAVEIDEAAIATGLRGNRALLRQTEQMIIEWASLIVFYNEQVAEAEKLLDLLEARIDELNARSGRASAARR
jgi:hypothetical protein